jgi:DNA-binding PadR family transcriptional regulator
MSSGTAYSVLYSLERNRLVKGVWKERERTYKLTLKGEETITTILGTQEKIKAFLSCILKPR